MNHSLGIGHWVIAFFTLLGWGGRPLIRLFVLDDGACSDFSCWDEDVEVIVLSEYIDFLRLMGSWIVVVVVVVGKFLDLAFFEGDFNTLLGLFIRRTRSFCSLEKSAFSVQEEFPILSIFLILLSWLVKLSGYIIV